MSSEGASAVQGKASNEGARVFLWCTPRTVSTAFTKCLSFIDDMEVWSEPFCYTDLATSECNHRLGVDLPFELEGNEEIFKKATELMSVFTNSQVETKRIVYANLKPRLEGTKSKYVFVKDMCLPGPEKVRRFLPEGFRHTFLIRTPERTLYSFRKSYFEHTVDLLTGSAAKYDTFDLAKDCYHMTPGYYVKEIYDLWQYVRKEIDPNPIVIDTDDLLKNPAAMMRRYCELVGLPFSDALMRWDPSTDIIKTWVACGDSQPLNMLHFYETALKSSCFLPASVPKKREVMTPDVIKGIQETMPFFEEMYQHRITI